MTQKFLRLVLIRHAKSSWKSDAPDDHSRPLNKRGRGDAPRVGRYLAEQGWLPAEVISSDSERTRRTVDGLYSKVDIEPDVRFTRALYHGHLADIREQVVQHAQGAMVAVVGHNPGWEDAVESLSGVYHRFTTCNAAVLECEAESWSDAFEQDEWTLVELVRPKEI